MTENNQGPKSRFERLVDFARLMFRARATELGMSSEEAIQERLKEDKRRHEQGSAPRMGNDQTGSQWKSQDS